jgi:cell division protein FtsQ
VALYAILSDLGLKARAALPLADQIDVAMRAAGLAIDEVSVAGHSRTLESEVFRALGPLDRSLPGLDVTGARGRIEALPWVRTATIHRVLPNKLKIEIVEREAAAVWHDGGRNHLIGRVLAPLGADVPSGLPRLSGPGAPDAAAALAQALAAHPDLRGRLAIAHRIGGRRWDLELDNGTRIRLPESALPASLARLSHIEREASVMAKPGRTIDLRQSRHVAISPAGAGAGAHPAHVPPDGASAPPAPL